MYFNYLIIMFIRLKSKFKYKYGIACIDEDNDDAQNCTEQQKYELMLPVMNDYELFMINTFV